MCTLQKKDLQPKKAKRVHCSKYKEVEAKLIHYIDLRSKLFKTDGKGLSWQIMQAKCEEWAKDENDAKYQHFKASSGFISNVLARNDIVGINLHGEGNEMSDEERRHLIATFKDKFHDAIEKDSIRPCCVYNADQTGLFYNKLPNRMYVKKTQECTQRGVKAMKDKARITIMVCTSASGAKVPLFVVGKSKNPLCFQKRKPPIEYASQSNSWFDQNVMKIWILKTFWPYHTTNFGNVPCILILDNFSGHKALFEGGWLPDKLRIIFLPANVTTSNHQPADMGIIAGLKVGYKAALLRSYLDIFDNVGGFEDAKRRRDTMPRGCRGLDVGGKATILDAMHILDSIWSNDSTYAREDGIQRCWRKSAILPLSWESDIHNKVGRASLTKGETQVPSELCSELCELMGAMVLKNRMLPHGVNFNDEALGLQNSFLHEDLVPQDDVVLCLDDPTITDVQAMAVNWWNIEDNRDVIEVTIAEAIEEIDDQSGGMVTMATNEDEDAIDPTEAGRGEADDDPPRPLLSYHEALVALEEVRRYLESKPADHRGCQDAAAGYCGTNQGLLGSLHLVDKLERDIRRNRMLGKRTQQPTLLHFLMNKPLAAGTDAPNEAAQRVTISSNSGNLNNDDSRHAKKEEIEDYNEDASSYSSSSSVGALSDVMNSTSNDIN
ncbi:DNA binding protein [Fragilaria crotonensis]|nr:DNA binding protein [Fragilaria crotonensis]